MPTPLDCDANEFIRAFATYLKKSGKLNVPDWADHVKTSSAKELAPYNQDWYYGRVAAIARQVYLRPNLGVGALRKIHGGKMRRGVRPNKFCIGSGSIQRKALQALEEMNILEKKNKGRAVSSHGRSVIDHIATQIVEKRNRL
ncbi:Protein component of the small (40S) ribosomal subunit [Coelomomyces lativittatus]|nr:Protein component of the small (40S) ribosomal subunit [Coelomomyces lativittatus]KAJ1505932.1 Protein component of the small (40S) ribosomal subunit [Coelomomyces lativittatus]KAJ1512140.1 Protein component of the small (40S) ribosomal subunit [Coelomomyces lativittatus]